MIVLRHLATRVYLAVVVALICTLVLAPQASAQPGSVVILPMTSTFKGLRIYRNAAPAALAARLSSALKVRVQAVKSAAEVPAVAVLIIDGRLVKRGKEDVEIEVRVRRAKTGQPVATVASGVQKITDIDALVDGLAVALKPVLARALVARAYTLPETVVHASADEGAPSRGVPPVTKESSVDILLLPAAGQAAQGNIDVREPATQATADMLARLGMSVGLSAQYQGSANAVSVTAEMRARNSKYSLMVQVLNVRFSYATVLSARGRVRAILIGGDGVPVFDKTVETDTVVGGRGDRHQALVYHVAEQALDILYPSFNRALRTDATIAWGRR